MFGWKVLKVRGNLMRLGKVPRRLSETFLKYGTFLWSSLRFFGSFPSVRRELLWSSRETFWKSWELLREFLRYNLPKVRREVPWSTGRINVKFGNNFSNILKTSWSSRAEEKTSFEFWAPPVIQETSLKLLTDPWRSRILSWEKGKASQKSRRTSLKFGSNLP